MGSPWQTESRGYNLKEASRSRLCRPLKPERLPMLFKAKPKQPFGPKRLALEAAKLSLLLAIISPCNQWLCNLMLFHPDTNAQLDQRAIAAINQRFKSTWTEEYFPSRQNNVVLNGWYIKLPNARKTI